MTTTTSLLTGRQRWRIFASKIKRGFTVAGIGLTILVTVWYFVEVWRCSQFTPTNDALFDTYARALINHQRWRLFHAGRHHAAFLPDEIIAKWERNFGSDPRYWQLRYWNTLQSTPLWDYDYAKSGAIHHRARIFLERAVEAGAADGNTYGLLYAETYEDFEFDDEGNIISDWLVAEPLVKLRVAWIKSAPESAWPHYTAALQYIGDKQLSEALAELRLGDTAPEKRVPTCFPAGFIVDRLIHDSPWPSTDNPVLVGSILSGEESGSMFIYGIVHNRIGDLVGWLAKNQSKDGLAALYRMGCAIGRTRDSDYLDVIGGLILIRRTSYCLLENFGEHLSTEERMLVLAAIDRSQRLAINDAHLMAAVFAQRRYLEDWNIVDVVANWRPVEPSPLDSFPLEYARHWWLINTPDGMRLRTSLASDQYFNHKNYTWEEFKQLSEIDLAKLELPKDWLDIGAAVSGMPQCHPDSEYAKQQKDWAADNSH